TRTPAPSRAQARLYTFCSVRPLSRRSQVRPPSPLANIEPCFIPAKTVPLSGSTRRACTCLSVRARSATCQPGPEESRSLHTTPSFRLLLPAALLALPSTGVATVGAEPSGTITWGVHVAVATRWLDTAETDAEITPFMVMYALHDALVKPMPSGLNTASLAESWSMSKDGRVWEFVLRKGPRFHNGDPVTAEDVKFSFERYRGAAAPLFRARVREVQVVDPSRVRFHLTEAWPDFMTFYGT